MKILYVTDGSEGALAVARFLSRLPHRRDVHVHIITAIDAEDLLDAGNSVLTTSEEALGSFAGHVTTGVTFASSKETIVQTILVTANYIDADLIALGASSHSPISRFFLGSITESVVHYAFQPVLVVRAPVEPLKEVIIGVDDSAESRRAACFVASKLPLPSNCTLHLVCAVSSSESPVQETAATEGIAQIRKCVEEVAYSLGEENDRAVETEVIVGESEKALLQAAEEHQAGLIVVGSHGRTGVERLLFGSVSERVVRHAPCSVLVVKQRPIEQG